MAPWPGNQPYKKIISIYSDIFRQHRGRVLNKFPSLMKPTRNGCEMAGTGTNSPAGWPQFQRRRPGAGMVTL